MKILFLINSLSFGGAERVTTNLANYWAEKNWQVTIVTLSLKSKDYHLLHPCIKRVGLNLTEVSDNPLSAISNNLRRILAIRRILIELRPDVAIAMMSSANILLALSSIGLKRIATVGAERTHPPEFPLGRAREILRKYLYGRLSSIVALTQESANWLVENTRLREIVVIPNPIFLPLPKFQPQLATPNMPNESRLLLSVGRLSEEKCFDQLILVFQRLIKDFPNWKLVILGEGPDRIKLEEQIEKADLGESITLPGLAGNVSQWYEIADLYVMTSRFEGFPNSLVEAMAHGCAAVSFDCNTGPRDIIRHEKDGLLVPVKDINGLEDALSKIMSNDSLRHRYSKSAYDVRERFSLEKIRTMWEQIFKKIMHD